MYYVAYLNEKFFYTTSQRKKLKTLPRGIHEEEGVDCLVRPKILSRRYPVKCMFMGVVARLIKHRNFNEKILLERVSNDQVVNKWTAYTCFSDDVNLNMELKNGG